VIFVVGLAASLAAGVLLQSAGWKLMNACLLPWPVVAFVAILWFGRRRRTTPPGT
jgi:hypothetical protein